jgi:hypothetical protein
MFSLDLKMLKLIHCITSSFSTAHTLCVLYTTLPKSKLEYVSVVWNYITLTDSSKLRKTHKENLLPYAAADFCGNMLQ